MYSYFFCVSQRCISLNKIWELIENGEVNQSSYLRSLSLKVPLESSKREAHSVTAKTNGREHILICDEQDQSNPGSQRELQILS